MTDPGQFAKLDELFRSGVISEAEHGRARADLIADTIGARPPPTPRPAANVYLQPQPPAPGPPPPPPVQTNPAARNRHVWPWIVGAVVVVVIVAVAISQSTTKKKTTGKQVGTSAVPTFASQAPATDVPTDTPPADTAAPAHVGDTINVKDQDGGDIELTLVKIAATAHSTDGFSAPSAGYRYFAAQFKITLASGAANYDDSPTNGAKALDAEDQQYDAALVQSIDSGPLLPSSLTIVSAHSAKGWMVFEVPTQAKITGVQFALSSGFGNGAQWIVP